jgi:lysozyme
MNNKLIGGALLVAVALVAANEGLRTESYPDVGGVWTDCYGRTKGVKPGTTATIEECDTALMKELIEHAKPLERLPYQLPDNVIIAWADFCYNVGVGACSNSTGYKMLERGDINGACAQLLRWKYVDKKDCSIRANGCYGIWKRRLVENRLCVGG